MRYLCHFDGPERLSRFLTVVVYRIGLPAKASKAPQEEDAKAVGKAALPLWCIHQGWPQWIVASFGSVKMNGCESSSAEKHIGKDERVEASDGKGGRIQRGRLALKSSQSFWQRWTVPGTSCTSCKRSPDTFQTLEKMKRSVMLLFIRSNCESFVWRQWWEGALKGFWGESFVFWLFEAFTDLGLISTAELSCRAAGRLQKAADNQRSWEPSRAQPSAEWSCAELEADVADVYSFVSNEKNVKEDSNKNKACDLICLICEEDCLPFFWCVLYRLIVLLLQRSWDPSMMHTLWVFESIDANWCSLNMNMKWILRQQMARLKLAEQQRPRSLTYTALMAWGFSFPCRLTLCEWSSALDLRPTCQAWQVQCKKMIEI